MLYLLIVSFIWAFSFGLIKTSLSGLDSVLVAFIRLLVSLLIFIPFLRTKSIGAKNGLLLIITGALQYGVMYIAYISSYQYLKAYEVALLTVFTPIYLVLIDSALKRKMERIYLFAGAASVFGAGLIMYKGLSSENVALGILLVQISNLAFAAGQVLYRNILRKIEENNDKNIFALLYLGAVFITAVVLPFRTAFDDIFISQSQWLALLYLGILPSGVGFFLWNYGARRVNAGTLSVFNNAKMPLAVFVSLLFFGEKTDLFNLFLGTIIISASLLLSERRSLFKNSR